MSSSNYYEMREAKVNIAHALMSRGWKVYGYYEDKSDMMTDYYDPASWDGIATKNGFTLVVDKTCSGEAREVTKYNPKGNLSASDREKITKLEQMTVDKGCTTDEEKTAKKLIEGIQAKVIETEKYTVVDTVPSFMENPNKSKWHIEKDGVIYDKGTALTKYADIPKYGFDIATETYKKGYDTWGDGTKKELRDNEIKAVRDFKALILRFERVVDGISTCGDGTAETEAQAQQDAKTEALEHITVTEYKTEYKAEPTTGEVKIGIDFILNNTFNYGCYKGLVYHVEDISYNRIRSHKYNGKLTKLCTGTASASNTFNCDTEKFQKWINDGSISIVNIVEVKTPYQVDKWVKKSEQKINKQPKENTQTESKTEEQTETSLEYDIKQDVDTRNNSKIFIIKVIKTLSKEEYVTVNEYMKSIGGYYSKFKHGFIFKANPTNILNGEGNTSPKGTETVNKDQETADYIIDCSTEIITELGLKYNEYSTNGEYINRLTDRINSKKINSNIISLLEYDDLKSVVQSILDGQKAKQQQETKQAKRQILLDKINKQIESAQTKIDNLSGDYQTNTYKRMNEQANRDSKKEGYQLDIEILQYLAEQLTDRDLTLFEENLIISAFRDNMHSYYNRHTAYNRDDRGTALKEIEFPQINYSCPLDGWWNKEVPQKQKQLQKAGITNTRELIQSAELYGEIYKQASKPVDRTAQKIKQLESEYKLQQKGDINFTPKTVAEQLIQLARIDGNSRVLEPSAGIGNIADIIKRTTSNIDVVEQMSGFRELLQLKGFNLVGYDFLEYETDQVYDAIIMNPPFSDEQNHIKHAYSLLKDGGTLVSITSPHWTFANDKKSVEFRNWTENENSYTTDLSSGTFEMTGVASKILVIEKPEQADQQTA